MNFISVYISVLNWNKAASTLACVQHLQKLSLNSKISYKVFVVDNGSEETDYRTLQDGLRHIDLTVIVTRLEKNLGFTGGHNLIISKAIVDNADYIWLVNNDGIPEPDTLAHMVQLAELDTSCGAVSPLIVALEDGHVSFCGGYHDWERLYSTEYDYHQDGDFFNRSTASTWVLGAAFMLRIAAIKQVGLLDEAFFAYSEDNDLCARLATAGWTSKIAFNAKFWHERPAQRPPYFYYLMTRNSFLFWLKHTPSQHRRFIRLRILEHALFKCNLRYHQKMTDGAKATLLGAYDGLFNGRGQPPELNEKVPWWMLVILWVLRPYHYSHIKRQSKFQS